ncbi:unnamed protein product [Rotaria sordida]|uniref:DUF7164 domain-containing protein n=1 Tax=Rotaria sordida TaxID=392033 RepID=A0A819B730_9BILA|nr:unnamed protein product [Rotaria sordida]CAF0966659.1 unnamed protein product [Rotaria sordida]CAF3787803.1 unnamed protein product [Rotaria sordida]CAF3807802.1 unnamed protein product [Rotaria sordida]
MFRFKTVSSILFSVAAILVFFVFILHILAPSYESTNNIVIHSSKRLNRIHFPRLGWIKDKTTTVLIPAEPSRQMTEPLINCRENLVTIEQYRSRSVVRGVIVRFPSLKSDYYFVQFRWFYRSWIESEMFTLDRWRTDIIIIIDDKFPNTIRKLLEHLDCHIENQRVSRRQISRCILINHKLFSQQSKTQQQFYIDKYSIFNRVNELDDNIDRLFSIYDYINQLNKTQTNFYDFLMITTMNTFLTTQFGKYIPIKCSFLLGTAPDYSTFYGKSNQISQFIHTLLYTLKESNGTQRNLSIDFSSTIEKLKTKFLFLEGQVDISCDSKKTTYRTSIYHLKCYAHSTSLFSERMFREKAYDGYEKEPFNIYIAREYATLMALQSKVMSLDDLHILAVNVTRREVYT